MKAPMQSISLSFLLPPQDHAIVYNLLEDMCPDKFSRDQACSFEDALRLLFEFVFFEEHNDTRILPYTSPFFIKLCSAQTFIPRHPYRLTMLNMLKLIIDRRMDVVDHFSAYSDTDVWFDHVMVWFLSYGFFEFGFDSFLTDYYNAAVFNVQDVSPFLLHLYLINDEVQRQFCLTKQSHREEYIKWFFSFHIKSLHNINNYYEKFFLTKVVATY